MARPTHRPGNLPPEITSFVGRRGELAELRTKLASARLVSLVGPGGVGKSRLAIRAATDLARGFKDGSWLVQLAEVRDPDLVPNAVLAALDLRDQAATEPPALLLNYLRDKRLLLVVDNCEHLLGAAGQLIGEIIRAAPGVRVIATSREPLSEPGEHVVPVPPLELPAAELSQPLDRLRQIEAVMLFTERANAASGSFELTAANQAAVVEVCRQLDGVPLAIELAAVRTRVLTPEQILDRLTDRFELLTAGGRAALPRHQTLRTAIDWSYDLLTQDEQRLLRRLCVFAGRFTLDDVEAVCMPDGETAGRTLGLVSSLVDKSLVMKQDAKGIALYRLHETMREYAVLKLRGAGEVDAVGLRCADYYVATCRQRTVDARAKLLAWLAWMDIEIDNIRAVLRHCLTDGDALRGLVLARSVSWYWFTRATTEGVRWLDQLMALDGGDPDTRAWALFIRGFLAVLQGDPTVARPMLDRAVAAGRQTMDGRLLSAALTMGSIAANMTGERVAARRLLDEAQQVTIPLHDPEATLGLLQAQAFNAFFEGELPTVKAVSSEGVRLSRETGDIYRLDMMLMNRGLSALFAGDLAEAKPFFLEALRHAREIDDRVAQFYLLDVMGCHAASSGQAQRAARLLGAAETIRLGAGATPMQFLSPLLDQATEAAVAAVGRAKYDAEFSAGRGLSRDDAFHLASGEPARVVAASSDRTGIGVLGKREIEVAQLLADGLTNKQIGVRLFISEKTVASHVSNILNKLGFSSRAQIAGWVGSANQ
jgi:predicted ATPase/DNA-binding CsgD family transcriptional regulator